MSEQASGLDIVDLYYADCARGAEGKPRWSAVRTREQLPADLPAGKLGKQLLEVDRKQKLEYRFGDDVVSAKDFRGERVRSIFQHILALPVASEGSGEFKEYGDVLAQKYLGTPFSRSCLFMLVRTMRRGKRHLFQLITDLTQGFTADWIDPHSHDIATQFVPNLIGDLRKGALYPAVIRQKPVKGSILIYDPERAGYFPQSMGCVLKRSPDVEARSLIAIILSACAPTVQQLVHTLQGLGQVDSIDVATLVEKVRQSGAEVDIERAAKDWEKHYYDVGYEVPGGVLLSNKVNLTLQFDEFEIKCPLRYYMQGRLKDREDGGLHYLTLWGRHYTSLRVAGGRARIEFPGSPVTPGAEGLGVARLPGREAVV